MAGNNQREYLIKLLSTSIPFIWLQLQTDQYDILGIFNDTEYLMRTKFPYQYFRLYPSKEFISFMNKTNVIGVSHLASLLDSNDTILNLSYTAPSTFAIDSSDQLRIDEKNIIIKKNVTGIQCDILNSDLEEVKKQVKVLCEELMNHLDNTISPEAKKILKEMGYNVDRRRSVFDSGKTGELKLPIMEFL